MNKRITLIRHAKSSWKDPQLADYDRPLNKRGRRDAVETGHRLHTEAFSPDLVLVSPALRAVRTIEAIADVAEIPEERLRFAASLYHASRNAMLELVRETDPAVEHLAVVGHNPGCESFAAVLHGGETVPLPTCAVVRLELRAAAARWADLRGGCARLCWIDTPKAPTLSR